MGGGLMQLVAYGAQDIYLTGNPQITFFKVVYRRHTNFSMEAIEQTFSGSPDFGRKVYCTISRNGDLIHRVYLQVKLPALSPTGTNSYARWVNWVGHALIKNVEIEIGGQRIDKHYGDWLHIWNELSQTAGKQSGYANMVGNVDRLYRPDVKDQTKDGLLLFVPLQFWFCRNPGLALPLIALQYHEVKINLEFRTFSELVGLNAAGDIATAPSLESASLFVDYIYLDTDERRRFAQVSHEYLIEQLQFTGDESVNQTNIKVKLNFNHPVKELVWVVQLDECVSSNAPTGALIKGRQWFNYTHAVDPTPYTQVDANQMVNIHDGVIDSAPSAGVAGTALGNLNFGILGTDADDVNAGVGAAGGEVGANNTGANSNVGLLSTLNRMFDAGLNPVETAKLTLNGHDRFAERDGRYFNLVQPYQHHERVPAPGINVYSFGLKPEEHQPSGTCNMSRIDNATLILKLNAAIATNSAKVRVYATNYNVLRIMSGMGGLAYSN